MSRWLGLNGYSHLGFPTFIVAHCWRTDRLLLSLLHVIFSPSDILSGWCFYKFFFFHLPCTSLEVRRKWIKIQMWLKHIVKYSEIFGKSLLGFEAHLYVLLCLNRQTNDPYWRLSNFLTHLNAFDGWLWFPLGYCSIPFLEHFFYIQILWGDVKKSNLCLFWASNNWTRWIQR